MKDLPIFTTENGVASLTLREIPYTKRAYVRLQDSHAPRALLEECCDFCRAVGAEWIYASGDAVLENYPYHTTVVTMQCPKERLAESDLMLWPVQEQTVHTWKEIYNQKAQRIANAAWMTDGDCREMLQAGEGYFVHNGKELMGIGRIGDGEIKWLASCAPGAGAQVLLSLASGIYAECVRLQVADTNQKAMELYKKLGFLAVEQGQPWYCLLEGNHKMAENS